MEEANSQSYEWYMLWYIYHSPLRIVLALFFSIIWCMVGTWNMTEPLQKYRAISGWIVECTTNPSWSVSHWLKLSYFHSASDEGFKIVTWPCVNVPWCHCYMFNWMRWGFQDQSKLSGYFGNWAEGRHQYLTSLSQPRNSLRKRRTSSAFLQIMIGVVPARCWAEKFSNQTFMKGKSSKVLVLDSVNFTSLSLLETSIC